MTSPNNASVCCDAPEPPLVSFQPSAHSIARFVPAPLTGRNEQDFFDIVATKGAYLVTEPSTPLFMTRINSDEFAAELQRKLKWLLVIQGGRKNKYGQQAAEEWPIGHTPPEMVEARAAKVKEIQARFDADTPPSSDDENAYSAKASSLRNQAAPEASRLPHQLATPTSPTCTIKTPQSCSQKVVESFMLLDSVLSVAAYTTGAISAPIQTKEGERDVEAGREDAEGSLIKAPRRTNRQRDGAKGGKGEAFEEQPISASIIDVEPAPQRPSDTTHNTPRGIKRMRDTGVEEEKEGTMEQPTKFRALNTEARRPKRRSRYAAS
jgi:hypothetical protein